jgi:predicted nucleic acid-binding protein
MKPFLDASVLVESCLSRSSKFAQADALVNQRNAVTSAHALAETYSTLSGDPRLKINPVDAARMVDELSQTLKVGPFSVEQYRALISGAPAKGIRGGSIYDALHAETARVNGCEAIHTLNVSHFRHVAPDLEVKGL